MDEFWIEVNYRVGQSSVFPFLGDRLSAEARIRQIVAMDSNQFVDFVLLLSGDWVPGSIAFDAQILADAQGYFVKGARRYGRGKRTKGKKRSSDFSS